ncbi:hypothetical protein CY34DRAFT_806260 [Suillus luteus UH-Slu-Lm8-n1]|uniref:Uncharacterized protein n=1 Tax=Suillus luteus UH-Slu-Lm8-n1 TaxID=930992 RepID=A0A0C9ZTN7_9AGAM|nr:hypothetical protein CY34DRAFT_806260 [Suillus luteus UH-Slu-Lm8-n1]
MAEVLITPVTNTLSCYYYHYSNHSQFQPAQHVVHSSFERARRTISQASLGPVNAQTQH